MRTVFAMLEKWCIDDIKNLNGAFIIFDENDILLVGRITFEINYRKEYVYHRLMVLKGFGQKIEICSINREEIEFEKFDKEQG